MGDSTRIGSKLEVGPSNLLAKNTNPSWILNKNMQNLAAETWRVSGLTNTIKTDLDTQSAGPINSARRHKVQLSWTPIVDRILVGLKPEHRHVLLLVLIQLSRSSILFNH